MRHLLPLIALTTLSADHYKEPANVYFNYGYKLGLVSETHSEHLDSYIGLEIRTLNSLFTIVKYGTAKKTQDTYNVECADPNAFVCTPQQTKDNSIKSKYIEYGASFHFIENRSGYFAFEVVNRKTLDDNPYFNGITTTLKGAAYLNNNYGISLSTGIASATGWNIAAEAFIKF